MGRKPPSGTAPTPGRSDLVLCLLNTGPPTDALVFDTGPLSVFARSNVLGVLKAVVGERRAIIPQAVVVELRQGVPADYRLRAVLDAEWIERRAVDTDAGYAALARFAKRLVSRGRNIGETEVLALAETMPATAVIDDGVAYKAAKKAKVRCTRTLALLCEAIHKGLLTGWLNSTNTMVNVDGA